MTSEALVNLLISLEIHQHPVAPLFNIVFLPNGEFFLGNKHICISHSISQAIYFFFAKIQILHVPTPSESSGLASRITQELNDIKVGDVNNSEEHISAFKYHRWKALLRNAQQHSDVFFFGTGVQRMQ